MKIVVLALFILVVSTVAVFAQKSVVLDAFSKYGIDPNILQEDQTNRPDDYAFDLKQTTIAGEKEDVVLANFDPSKAEEDRWTVQSMDGQSPSPSKVKTCRRHQQNRGKSPRPNDASYHIEKETPAQLVISYEIDPTSTTRDNAF